MTRYLHLAAGVASFAILAATPVLVELQLHLWMAVCELVPSGALILASAVYWPVLMLGSAVWAFWALLRLIGSDPVPPGLVLLVALWLPAALIPVMAFMAVLGWAYFWWSAQK